MIGLFELAEGLSSMILPIVSTIIAIAVLYLIFVIILRVVKKSLLKVAKTKKQITNVEVFTAALRYIFLFFLVLAAVFSSSGSWEGLAITFGLLSAAIGFALQRPITGLAAWIMIVTRRPFEIGDRIIIGIVKGDVSDISLTHITLREIGGLVQTEENSGRTIIIPNSVLFEQNIINYTHQDEFVLNQVTVSVTYESNLEKASEICLEAAKKHTKQFLESFKKEPYVRVYFEPSGVGISVRFFVPTKRLTEISSSITKEIYDSIIKAKDVEFAYPHTEVLLRQKGQS